MFKETAEYLKHLADECTYILSVTNSLEKAAFLNDETLKRAVVRSLEIIGEAQKRFLQSSGKNTAPFNGKAWWVCEIA